MNYVDRICSSVCRANVSYTYTNAVDSYGKTRGRCVSSVSLRLPAILPSDFHILSRCWNRVSMRHSKALTSMSEYGFSSRIIRLGERLGDRDARVGIDFEICRDRSRTPMRERFPSSTWPDDFFRFLFTALDLLYVRRLRKFPQKRCGRVGRGLLPFAFNISEFSFYIRAHGFINPFLKTPIGIVFYIGTRFALKIMVYSIE